MPLPLIPIALGLAALGGGVFFFEDKKKKDAAAKTAALKGTMTPQRDGILQNALANNTDPNQLTQLSTAFHNEGLPAAGAALAAKAATVASAPANAAQTAIAHQAVLTGIEQTIALLKANALEQQAAALDPNKQQAAAANAFASGIVALSNALDKLGTATVVTQTDPLNVHTAAGVPAGGDPSKTQVVGSVPKDKVVQLMGHQQQGFYFVTYPEGNGGMGLSGFASAKYLHLNGDATVDVTQPRPGIETA